MLQNRTRTPLTSTRVMFSAPTSCQTDTPVWTAVSTVHSTMYSNNGISHELTNFNFVPLVHLKVKSTSSMCRDVATIEPEPAGPVISTFHGNTALNDSEKYFTRKLPLNIDPVRPVDPAFSGNMVRNDPVGPVNPAFCGNVALIASET